MGRLSYRADLAYPERRLLIEADGRDYHTKWADVAADMTRQNALVGLGWRILRFTWRQVLFQPDLTVRTVRDALLINEQAVSH